MAERSHPDARVEERAPQRRGLRPRREFDDADAAQHPHVADAGQPTAGFQTLRQRRREGGDLRQARLAFEQIE